MVSCSHWGMFAAADQTKVVNIINQITINSTASKEDVGRTAYQAAQVMMKRLGI